MSSGNTPPRFPPIKSQAYSASVPDAHTFFHPAAVLGGKRKKRGILCTLLLWSLVVLILSTALLLATVFLIYQPRLPAFSISSISVKHLSVSEISASVDSKFQLTVTARNPNSKLRFEYGTPLSVSVAVGDVDVADGEFNGFVHRRKHTAVLRASVGSGGKRQLTGEEVRSVAAGVKSGAEVRIEGKVRVLFWKLRSPAMVLQVRCKGINVTVKGRHQSSGRAATGGGGKCEVKFKGKVLRWTV